MVRSVTFEIRWHDTQPIYSCSFQPLPPQQLRRVLDYNLGQASGLNPDKTFSSEHATASSPTTTTPSTPSTSASTSGAASAPGPSAKSSARIDAPVEIAGGQNWRLATAGGDNNVRIWLVKPGIPSPAALASATSAGLPTPPPHPPRVEYMATLSRHSGVVNCVRFSPTGDMLASAGDDGTVMLWHLTDRPPPAFGADVDEAETGFEKEHWRMVRMIRVSTQEIYDMAWSPNGESLVVGGTDFVARIINPHDGSILKEFSDHAHYVQGVAWDPLNEYLATQSSDRSVHVHTLTPSAKASTPAKSGGLSGYVPPVTRNSRMDVHRRTGSGNLNWEPKPAIRRGSSHTSHVESDTDDEHARRREGFTAVRGRTARSNTPMEPPSTTPAPSMTSLSTTTHHGRQATPTPASSVPQSPAFSTASASAHPMNPPQRTPSRRSSFSGSQAEVATSPPTSVASFAPGSASAASIYKAAVGPAAATAEHTPSASRRSVSRARSIRSPSPAPLPAIRPPPSPRQRIHAAQLANSGYVGGGSLLQAGMRLYGDESFSGFFRRLTFSPDGALLVTPSGVFDAPSPASPSKSPSIGPHSGPSSGPRSTVYMYGRASLTRSNAPLVHLPGHKNATLVVRFSPILYELRKSHISAFPRAEDGGGIAPHPNVPLEAGKQKSVSLNLESSKKGRSHSSSPNGSSKDSAGNGKPSTASPPRPISLIGLPYRMVFAVATHDVVWIYDTQQGGPICCFSNMHYAAFTDLTWSADGQTLIMSSSDGYCSVAVFDYGELGTPYMYSAQPSLSASALSHLPTANIHHAASTGNAVTTLSTKKRPTTTKTPGSTPGGAGADDMLRTPPPLSLTTSGLDHTAGTSSSASWSSLSASVSHSQKSPTLPLNASASALGIAGLNSSGSSQPAQSQSKGGADAAAKASGDEQPKKRRRIQPTLKGPVGSA